MAQFKINTLLLQIKLLLWKNYKLKTRRWKEILLMIGFAVFSMLLIGVFRSDIETTTIPAYEPSPQRFFDYLQSNYHLIDGKLAIINKLSDNIENTQKILSLQSSLSQWFNNYHNNITIITNITSDTQLDNIIQTQNNDTSSNIANEIRLAIDINKWDLNNFDYTIRLPSTWVPSSSDPLINQQTSTASITQTLGIGHSYATQFIPLQIWLDEFYIQYNNNYTTNNTSIIPYLSINLQYQQFWTKSHQNDPFMELQNKLLTTVYPLLLDEKLFKCTNSIPIFPAIRHNLVCIADICINKTKLYLISGKIEIEFVHLSRFSSNTTSHKNACRNHSQSH
eukprot:381442_1